MDYIVLDLEWNQPVETQEESIEGLPFEIIEIGAVKLNSDFQLIDKFSQVIKPQIYQKMNYITKKLIHLDTEELNAGRSFVEVATEFMEFCGEDYRFCTWGQLDLLELQRNMDFFHMPALCSGPLKFYDVQKMFSIIYEDSKLRRALEYAVDYLRIEKDVAFHRAYSDAYYTARIFQQMKGLPVLERVSFDVYRVPATRVDEIYIVFDEYAKYISREFADKTEAMEDKQVSSMKCYLCNKNVRRKIKWFTPNGKHFYGVGICDKHGMIKYKVRMKKTQDDKVFVVKTSKLIDQEEFDQIYGKKDRTRMMRQQKRQTKANERRISKNIE